MRLICLQSGSNGNCVYVEAGRARLLLDAGISGKQAQQRLASHARDIHDVDAVIISHDHADHIRCAGVYQRKFFLPLHVTSKTLAESRRYSLGRLSDVRHFQTGEAMRFDGVTVETIPTPHDGCDGVAFVIDDGKRRLGILTDLGHVFDGLLELIGSLDAVLLESNYDPDMLAAGPYPANLKRRIRGPGGHLSNIEAAELLAGSASRRMKWTCLGHLSEANNCPDVAVATHRQILGKRMDLHVASRYRVSDVMTI